MTTRVLVVDDSATVRFELTRQLTDAGFDVVDARSGQEALKKLAPGHGVDVIVSDLKMPGIDGKTLVKTVQHSSDLAVIPVYILTSSTDVDDHIQNLDAGASAYITKPWNTDVLVATINRLASLKQRQSEMAVQSRIDRLTGLTNRGHGEVRLQEEIDRCRRYGREMAVAMVDIDHFKKINDTLGHAAGDEVLRSVSARLRAVSRASDTIVRFRAHLAGNPVHVKVSGGLDLPVTVSGGVAGLEADDTAESLVERADSALYRAKESGRNQLLMWQLGQLQPVLSA